MRSKACTKAGSVWRLSSSPPSAAETGNGSRISVDGERAQLLAGEELADEGVLRLEHLVLGTGLYDAALSEDGVSTVSTHMSRPGTGFYGRLRGSTRMRVGRSSTTLGVVDPRGDCAVK